MSGSAAGFADEIAIGRYGTRAAHRRDVVLRATLPRPARPRRRRRARQAADELYFRGAAYDGYESGRWVHSHKPELRTIVEPRRRAVPDRRGLADRGRPVDARWPGRVRQEIEAIGIPASVLFAIDRPRAFELPAAKLGAAGALRVFPRWSGEAGAARGRRRRRHVHHAVARALRRLLAAPRRRRARRGRAVWRRRARGAYLALSPADFARAAGEPGRDARRAATSRRRQIAAVTRALRAKHGYTLEPQPAAARASIRSRASCSASAPGTASCSRPRPCCCCALRGVPARYVTGFRGGEWNAVGGYVAVRDDRAHAWAEAFLPDAAGCASTRRRPGAPPPRAGPLSEVMDALDYFWNRWVVGYDLGRQLELARRAGRHLVPRAAHAPARASSRWSVAARACWRRCCSSRVGLRRRRARARARRSRRARAARSGRRRASAPIDRLYRRTLGRLARAGWPRRRNETPHEYAQRVRRVGPDRRPTTSAS